MKRNKLGLLIVLVFGSVASVFAVPPPPPPGLPLDSGLGVLIALALGYGIKKIRNNK